MAKSVAIGLDIGTSHVRAAEVQFSGSAGGRRSGVTLTRFGQVPLPPGAVREGEVEEPTSVTAAIRRLWAEQKFSSRDVNLGVGNQRVVVRELDLPWMPAAQVRAALPFQVQEMLPMATDEALLDFYPTAEVEGPAGRMLHGLLVAATRDTVNANVMAAESAGLRPRMVDLNPFALLRAVAVGDFANRTVAIVEIGARITHVVIAAQGVPRFVRTLPSGGDNVTDAVAGALGIPSTEAEAVKREVGVGFAARPELAGAVEAVSGVVRPLLEAIRNTFVYYQGNNPGSGIEVVTLTGGGAHLPGLGQYLSSASRLPVTMGDPFAAVSVAKTAGGDRVAQMSSFMALSLGLAYGVAA